MIRRFGWVPTTYVSMEIYKQIIPKLSPNTYIVCFTAYLDLFVFRFKGSREVFDGDKYEISADGDRYTLVVKNVFGEDQDEYVVRASNGAGSKTSRADLEISCMSIFLVFWHWYILATSRENLSLGFATRYDSNWPAQLQKLARVLKLWI